MNKFQAFIVACLIAIVANLTYSNFKNSAETSVTATQKQTVVEIVAKVSTPYDALGNGMNGFIVKYGNELQFVKYDSGSMFDKMPTPKYLNVAVTPNGQVGYIPLTTY